MMRLTMGDHLAMSTLTQPGGIGLYCNTIAQSKLACSKMVSEFRAAVRSARTENGFLPLCYTMYALILGWKKRARMSELSPLFSLSPGTVFTLCIIVHLATGSAINDGPTLPFLQHWVFLVEYYFS